jgi:DNA-binding MarR family transcriptional regulator
LVNYTAVMVTVAHAPSRTDPPAGRLVMGVAEYSKRRFDAAAAEFDLSSPEARALLSMEEEASMRALADHLACDPSYVTGLADGLEARGLIARTAGAKDRRVKVLVLTPEGRTLRERLRARVIATSPVERHLTPRECEELRALLGKVLAAEEADG